LSTKSYSHQQPWLRPTPQRADITPHVAILGTHYRQKWEAILLENCRRFAAGQPLLNVVDKEKWF
jgi:phosphoglycerate dehydrogenase-like enzyme